MLNEVKRWSIYRTFSCFLHKILRQKQLHINWLNYGRIACQCILTGHQKQPLNSFINATNFRCPWAFIRKSAMVKLWIQILFNHRHHHHHHLIIITINHHHHHHHPPPHHHLQCQVEWAGENMTMMIISDGARLVGKTLCGEKCILKVFKRMSRCSFKSFWQELFWIATKNHFVLLQQNTFETHIFVFCKS